MIVGGDFTSVRINDLPSILHPLLISCEVVQSQLLTKTKDDGADEEQEEGESILLPAEYMIPPNEELTLSNFRTFVKSFSYFGLTHQARKTLLRFLVDRKDLFADPHEYARTKKAIMIPLHSTKTVTSVPFDKTLYAWLELFYNNSTRLQVEGVLEFAKNYDLESLLIICENYPQDILSALSWCLKVTNNGLQDHVEDHILFTMDKIIGMGYHLHLEGFDLWECSSVQSIKYFFKHFIRCHRRPNMLTNMIGAVSRSDDSLEIFKLFDIFYGWLDVYHIREERTHDEDTDDDDIFYRMTDRFSDEEILSKLANGKENEFSNDLEFECPEALVHAVNHGNVAIVRYIIDDRNYNLSGAHTELISYGCSVFSPRYCLPRGRENCYNFPFRKIEHRKISETWELILNRCVQDRRVHHEELFSDLWLSAVKHVNYFLLGIFSTIEEVAEVFHPLQESHYLKSIFGMFMDFNVNDSTVMSTVLPIVQECVYKTYQFLKERGVSIRRQNINSNLSRMMILDFSNGHLIHHSMISDGFQLTTEDVEDLVLLVFTISSHDLVSFQDSWKPLLLEESYTKYGTYDWTRHPNEQRGEQSLRLLKEHAVSLLRAFFETLPEENGEHICTTSFMSRIFTVHYRSGSYHNWLHATQLMGILVKRFGALKTMEAFAGSFVGKQYDDNTIKRFCLHIVQHFRNTESNIPEDLISRWDKLESLCRGINRPSSS